MFVSTSESTEMQSVSTYCSYTSMQLRKETEFLILSFEAQRQCDNTALDDLQFRGVIYVQQMRNSLLPGVTNLGSCGPDNHREYPIFFKRFVA